jgi:hypothetical protein
MQARYINRLMRILFEEKQRFTQWWLWTILVFAALLVAGIVINALYVQLVLGQPWGDKPMSDEGLIAFTLFITTMMVIMLMMFFSAVLEIKVDKSGIVYRYFPLIRRERRIDREDIQHFEVKKYFLRGYGIRYNFRGEKTINVKGHMGMEITTRNGKRLMLGTQMPDEFLHALNVMKKGSDNQ